jgi:NADH:ubiquinone oxidoreductase subunit 5 (subunit L)/multisubunit Na+/H+ antiporter MnhA subunit
MSASTLIQFVVLLPLIAVAIIVYSYMFKNNRGEQGEKFTSKVSLVFLSASVILMLMIDLLAVFQSTPNSVIWYHWLFSGAYNISFVLQIDTLALTTATLVTIIALIVAKFSVNYLHREKGYQRFFIVTNLFSSAMLLIVLSGNVTTMFIGWELAGVSSFLLIGYAFDREVATKNANQAFITNRIGDVGFIMGIFLSFSFVGGVSWLELGQSQLQPALGAAIAGSFLLAIMAKSAQVPFSPWIAKALEGPTPSSAIFYGALMVHAGIYLLIRLEPLFAQSPLMMILLVVIGTLTVFYGYLSGLVQTDVKSNLSFSTTVQTGLMVVTIGLGFVEVAMVHMLLHMMWRSYQFLHAPAIMHQMTRKTRQVQANIFKNNWLFTAAIQRFWLDQIGQWLLARPTNALAKDFKFFEDHFIARITGLPAKLDFMLLNNQSKGVSLSQISLNDVGFGRGLAGKVMEKIAFIFEWFEENIILKAGGEGLVNFISRIGRYLLQIDILLTQPRYLLLIIMATFVVVL